MAKKDIKHAFLYVLGTETHKNAWLMSFPTFFWFKEIKQFLNKFVLLAKNMVGKA